MSSNETPHWAEATWLVRPTRLPLIRRWCLNCPSTLYRTHGKFRVNANRKILDVWLLALCVDCDETVKLTVRERVHVRSIDPKALDRFHGNDLDFAAELLADPSMLRRNDVSLDWDGAWVLDTGADDLPKARVVDVSIRFIQRIPIRRIQLVSDGLRISRAEVARLVANETIVTRHRLSEKASGDFGFSFHR